MTPIPPHSPARCVRLALLLGATAWLGACASLAPTPTTSQAMAPVPATWSAPTAGGPSATPLAQWWQRFTDPQLTGLGTQALQAHTSVRSAQAALLQARVGLGPAQPERQRQRRQPLPGRL